MCFIFGASDITLDFIQKITPDNYRHVYSLPHVEIYDVNQYLESIFEQFNSEANPLYYSHAHQHNYNDTHTSMSIGDIISFKGELFMVSGEGFQNIKKIER